MMTWTTALDHFEQQLAQCRDVLDNDADPSIDIWPPADLTTDPIPPEEVERARNLLTAAFELEAELLARRAALPSPRPSVRRRRQPRSSVVSTEL